jgi:hypothetical protein
MNDDANNTGPDPATEHHTLQAATEGGDGENEPVDQFQNLLEAICDLAPLIQSALDQTDADRQGMYFRCCLCGIREIAAACNEILAADDAEHAELLRRVMAS